MAYHLNWTFRTQPFVEKWGQIYPFCRFSKALRQSLGLFLETEGRHARWHLLMSCILGPTGKLRDLESFGAYLLPLKLDWHNHGLVPHSQVGLEKLNHLMTLPLLYLPHLGHNHTPSRLLLKPAEHSSSTGGNWPLRDSRHKSDTDVVKEWATLDYERRHLIRTRTLSFPKLVVVTLEVGRTMGHFDSLELHSHHPKLCLVPVRTGQHLGYRLQLVVQLVRRRQHLELSPEVPQVGMQLVVEVSYQLVAFFELTLQPEQQPYLVTPPWSTPEKTLVSLVD